MRSLSETGSIITFTKVHKGDGHLPEPYILAVIDLGQGRRVLARLDTDQEVRIGQTAVFAREDENGLIYSVSAQGN
jgi:uncharacterized OB-fold protein